MIGLADGLRSGFGMGMQARQAADARERQAREDAWQDEQRTRLRRQWGAEDSAWRDLETLQGQGVVEGATGISQPSMQMLAAGNGGAYGSGEGAIRDAAGDYTREMNRLGQGENAPATGVPATGVPAYNAQAPIARRAASDLEVERAMGGVAMARRDMAGLSQSRARQKQLSEDEILAKAEVNDATISYINDNHRSLTIGDPDKHGFRQVSFVKVGGKAAFDRLSPMDQRKLAGAQALYATNPTRALQLAKEVNADLAKVFETEAREGEAVVRSGNDAAFKGGSLDNDAARTRAQADHWAAQTRNDAARLGMQRDRAKLENWQLERLRLGDTLGQEAAGYAEGLSAAHAAGPQGRSAADIYGAKLAGVHQRMRGLGLNPGGREQMSLKDQLDAEAKLIQAGMSPEQARARVTGYDPVEVMRAEIAKLRGAKGAVEAGALGHPRDIRRPQAGEPPGVQLARKIEAMSDDQVAAYRRLQENQPLSPRERNLLREAGIEF